MGAAMSLRRPRKPRVAAVAAADADPEAGGAAERAEEKVVPLTEKQGIAGEVPKPRAVAVAVAVGPSDPCVEEQEATASPLKKKGPEEVPGEPDVYTLTSADPNAKAGGEAERAELKEGNVLELKDKQGGKDKQGAKVAGEVPKPGAAPVDLADSGTKGAAKREEEKASALKEDKELGEVPESEVVPVEAPKPRVAAVTSHNPEPKGPLLIAAKIEASNTKAKVEDLCLAAFKLKSEGIKPMKKLTKVEKWASEASDRRVFSEYLKAMEVAAGMEKGNCHAYVPCPPFRRFRINPHMNVIPAHLSERKQLLKPGINMVMIDGSFAVPSSFVSGNRYIDSMNLILFDIYMSVNLLLAEAQAAKTLAKLELEVLPKEAEVDLKAAVRELRTSGHGVRSSISGVGGLPLREPTLYWREAFPDVMV